jgi:hypothetical protein
MGSTTAKEEEEEEVALLHLMVLVDLRKGKESNSFLPYWALVDSGNIYIFVSQAVANSVRMRPAKARRQERVIAKLLMIATVNSESLRTMAAVWQIVRMRHSAVAKHCHTINFVVNDIAG